MCLHYLPGEISAPLLKYMYIAKTSRHCTSFGLALNCSPLPMPPWPTLYQTIHIIGPLDWFDTMPFAFWFILHTPKHIINQMNIYLSFDLFLVFIFCPCPRLPAVTILNYIVPSIGFHCHISLYVPLVHVQASLHTSFFSSIQVLLVCTRKCFTNSSLNQK